ncbi:MULTISPECIES: response regulator transcription factor [unclassified Sphingobacterium]|uniref:response regulator n=1 Tax=unclassified Sphingobacterium TaxID=2609468 RepID=UPI00105017C9|nr:MULTISPECIES: response regulator transcription factor [unclassified Sphingobacterium]MCS3552799.1 DNA-binding NarL/FixJ family response regulator [Sphingobacterium sp. JUb21]TCR10445.1 LuxR family two component transcriptional regulator [Sphingobacterium sp. JUb20]
MVKIVIAEDHLVVLNGVKLLLESQSDLEVIDQGTNGNEVLEIMSKGNIPDVLITDINMADMDGLELISKVKAQYPSVRIIVLSMLNNLQHVLQAFKNGANGYLVKNVGYEEMLYAIRHVAKGGQFICEEIGGIMLDTLQKSPTAFLNIEQIMEKMGLSEREMEVLELIGEGYTNMQIADKLFLSKRTVEGHRQNLLEKTGVKNTAALIKYAIRTGLMQ